MRSREYDLDFRDRNGRIRAWGIALLAVSALLWTWCALLLLTPYEAGEDHRSPDECESRLFTDRGTANGGVYRGYQCANERDWPEALAVLGLSVPVSVAGVALFTSGSLGIRMSAHAQALRELDQPADAWNT
ncbi:hypothetical protein ABZ532_19805 [Streptomyces sp. NPDC019396]|uniref:hypothetical protein n=1 Tax=Streptomyces sp. NPDC019396 TaxID=3154687 RepID=UPI00340F644A